MIKDYNYYFENFLRIVKVSKKAKNFENLKNCEDCEDCPFFEITSGGLVCIENVRSMIIMAARKLGYSFKNSEEVINYFDDNFNNADICGLQNYLIYNLAKRKIMISELELE